MEVAGEAICAVALYCEGTSRRQHKRVTVATFTRHMQGDYWQGYTGGVDAFRILDPGNDYADTTGLHERSVFPIFGGRRETATVSELTGAQLRTRAAIQCPSPRCSRAPVANLEQVCGVLDHVAATLEPDEARTETLPDGDVEWMEWVLPVAVLDRKSMH